MNFENIIAETEAKTAETKAGAVEAMVRHLDDMNKLGFLPTEIFQEVEKIQEEAINRFYESLLPKEKTTED